jgi:sugar phosphate isomerase/epimerase
LTDEDKTPVIAATAESGAMIMPALSLDFLSVFGMPPVAFVDLAADLGCQHISMAPEPPDYNPHGYPAWSLRDNAGLRRELLAALHARGLTISIGEGPFVVPDHDVVAFEGDVELMAQLGAPRLVTLSFDPDLDRTRDQFRRLADIAAGHGLDLCLEFTPSKRIATFAQALDMVRQVDRPNMRIVLDTMHFARSGSKLSDLVDADPAVIGYVQLCDAAKSNQRATYAEEAIHDRLAPGAGELPLREILAAAPRDRIVGLEIPMRAQAEAGVGPYDRLKPAVDAARRLIAETGA